MSFSLVRSVARLEQADELHLARLLVLLGAATKRRRTSDKEKTIKGITKLAKLDFLLRYPNCLERALKVLNYDPVEANVQDYERDSVESSMIRFKYGPWDDRYRRWIGLLVARGLAVTYVSGNTVHVGLTEEGTALAATLSELEEFQDFSARSKLVVRAVGSLSATRLKDFVYKTFPELSSMRWGEEIEL